MIIKKTSWHYKMISFFDMTPKESLCPYVRQMLIGIGMTLFMIAIACVMLTILVWAPLHVLLALAGILTITSQQLGIGLIVWVVYTIVGIVFGGKYLRKKYREKNPIQNKEPGIVMAYIKAKKEKICPALDFQE